MRNYPAPITGRKLRFALIGCGRIAKNHFASILKHAENVDLVSICDVDPQALATAAEETGDVYKRQGRDALCHRSIR